MVWLMELIVVVLLLIVLVSLPKKTRPKEGGFLIGLRVLTVGLLGVFAVMVSAPLFGG